MASGTKNTQTIYIKNKNDLEKYISSIVAEKDLQSVMKQLDSTILPSTLSNPFPVTVTPNKDGLDIHDPFSYHSFLEKCDESQLRFKELLCALLKWGVSATGITLLELKGYLNHLSYICQQAVAYSYDITVHAAYDKAMRVQAQQFGWRVFWENDTGLNTIYNDAKETMLNRTFKDEIHELEQGSKGSTVVAKSNLVQQDLTLETEKPLAVTVEPNQKVNLVSVDSSQGNEPGNGDIKSQTTKEDTSEMDDLNLQLSSNDEAEEDPDYEIANSEVYTDSGSDGEQNKTPTSADALGSTVNSLKNATGKASKEKSKLKMLTVTKCERRTISSALQELNIESEKGESAPRRRSKIGSNPNSEETEDTNRPSIEIKFDSAEPRKKGYLCPHCGKRLNSLYSYKCHLRLHTGELPYQCTKCDKAFKGKQQLNSHMRLHNGQACERPHCDKVFLRDRQLKLHLMSHNGQRDYVCDQCGKGCMRPCDLRNHIARMHQDNDKLKPFSCDMCHQRFGNAKNRTLHMEKHGDDAKYECLECGLKFKFQKTLKQHNKRKHQTIKARYKCDLCLKEFKSRITFDKHVYRHSEPLTNKSKIFSCKQCKRSYRYQYSLTRHIKFVHSLKNPTYTCTQCDQTFKTKEVLSGHLRLHTGEKPLCCHECGKKFLIQCALYDHIKTHSRERPCLCPLCGKSFKTKNTLREHHYVHITEAKYVCQFCGKSFKRPGTLKMHLFSHSTEKNYHCYQCEKAFKDPANLKAHIARHSTNRPTYLCSICGKAFLSRKYQRKHEAGHPARDAKKEQRKLPRPPRKFQCTECGKIVSSLRYLRKHMKNHERDQQKVLDISKTPYVCNECGKGYTLPRYLARHKIRMHQTRRITASAANGVPEHDPEKGQFVCEVCSRVFTQQASLARHMTRKGHGDITIHKRRSRSKASKEPKKPKEKKAQKAQIIATILHT